jgi:hypothetical protein
MVGRVFPYARPNGEVVQPTTIYWRRRSRQVIGPWISPFHKAPLIHFPNENDMFSLIWQMISMVYWRSRFVCPQKIQNRFQLQTIASQLMTNFFQHSTVHSPRLTDVDVDVRTRFQRNKVASSKG